MGSKISLFVLFVFWSLIVKAQQINIQVTNVQAENVLKGNFNPVSYLPPFVATNPQIVFQSIATGINSDSLKLFTTKLASFHNRNTGSDTSSATIGIGAARTWAFNKFNSISKQNNNRLLPSYLKFQQTICSVNKHKNVLAVLPGSDTSDHQIILIEAHLDSRCSTPCDINCEAQGVEDNATGSALVLELARVMSRFSFKHTIVFMLTTAEEQGLYGSNAFALFANDNDLPIKAVLNNDVVGGIYCGKTSSEPSCPGLNAVDSTQVRLFSAGIVNSAHKQLTRFIKLEYDEEIKTLVQVPMNITIMSAEDRTGRSGDHIPFREKGYPAIRFTSANEHGNGSNGPEYTDRQHTSEDILGVDTDDDNIIDSFFVDFNYLQRNGSINGVAAAAIGWGVPTPKFSIFGIPDPNKLKFSVNIEQLQGITKNRIAIRTISNDWDTVYFVNGNYAEITPKVVATNYYVSVAAMNNNGVESMFSNEQTINAQTISLEEETVTKGLELLQNRPNPFDETTFIGVIARADLVDKKATIRIVDMTGKVIQLIDFQLKEGLNEVLYEHGYGKTGNYIYTLELDGKIIESRTLVFSN